MKKQMPISILTFSMIICMKLTEDPFVQQFFVAGYFLGCATLSVFFVFVVGLPAITAFNDTVQESIKSAPSPKMEALGGKVKVLLRELTNNGYSNTATTGEI